MVYRMVSKISRAADSLRDYIRRIMFDNSLTFKRVAEQSRGEISTGGLNDLLKGRTVNPTIGTLKALAKGLGVTEEEIFAVALGRPLAEESANETRLLAKFRALPADRQADVLRIVDALQSESATPSAGRTKKGRAA
jgi:transcriptional regulator with XRE-family HTH domain